MNYNELARRLPKKERALVKEFNLMLVRYPHEMKQIKRLIDEATRTNDAGKYNTAMSMYQQLRDRQ